MSEESGMVGTEEDGEPNIARVLNINVGDKKKHCLNPRLYQSLSGSIWYPFTRWGRLSLPGLHK